MSDFEALYRAVESRDARWDGRVFVGVTSTGIYCPGGGPAGPGVRLRLAYRAPLDVAGLLAFVAARAIPGVEAVDDRSIRRAIRTAGRVAMVRLVPAPDALAMDLAVDEVGPGDLAGLVAAARRSLDLDADPAAIDAALVTDPIVGPLVAASPGRRLPGAFDPWATTVLAILAQGTALSSARTAAGRLAATFGEPVVVDEPLVDRLFPSAERLAGVDLASVVGLGVPHRRLATVAELARRVADGSIDLAGGGDHRATREALLSVPGVGPWTVAYMAMRVLRDPDAFPPGDAAIRAAFRRRGLAADDGSIARAAESWRPWRGYAVAHLWSAG